MAEVYFWIEQNHPHYQPHQDRKKLAYQLLDNVRENFDKLGHFRGLAVMTKLKMDFEALRIQEFSYSLQKGESQIIEKKNRPVFRESLDLVGKSMSVHA